MHVPRAAQGRAAYNGPDHPPTGTTCPPKSRSAGRRRMKRRPPVLHPAFEILERIRKGRTVSWNKRWWDSLAQRVYRHQCRKNPVYRRWVHSEKKSGGGGRNQTRFPALPIVAFKESVVAAFRVARAHPFFESSGTTGRMRMPAPRAVFRPGPGGIAGTSRHYFRSLTVYRASVIEGWRWFLRESGFDNGRVSGAAFAGVMPSFSEARRSSLSSMVQLLMDEFGDGRGFWCMRSGRWDWSGFAAFLERLARNPQPAVLFGTAFGWMHFLDWCVAHRRRFRLGSRALVLETGGYKGRSRSLGRAELYRCVARVLGVAVLQIRGEYSMCEVSSQAYSFPIRTAGAAAISAEPVFRFPPWCRHRVVAPDSRRGVPRGSRGVLEIHDLANVDSCAWIRTEDMAIERGGGFEIVGRLPQAELKGCSLAFESG